MVNNCGTGLGVVFRGVPSDTLKNQSSGVRILDGKENWEKRTDATLIGKNLQIEEIYMLETVLMQQVLQCNCWDYETLDDGAQNDNVALYIYHFSTSFENRSWPCYSI